MPVSKRAPTSESPGLLHRRPACAAAALLGLALTASCGGQDGSGGGSTGSPASGTFSASITGLSFSQMKGDAHFSHYVDQSIISLDNPGTADTILLTYEKADYPRPGTFTLADGSLLGISTGRWNAGFLIPNNNVWLSGEGSGTLTLTSVDQSLWSGSFQFKGFAVDGSTITVSGSFGATPH